MTVPSLKLGLIGLGNMGQNHLRVLSLLKGVEIAFIHDADAARQAKLASAYDVPGVNDVDAAMAGLDAVWYRHAYLDACRLGRARRPAPAQYFC